MTSALPNLKVSSNHQPRLDTLCKYCSHLVSQLIRVRPTQKIRMMQA